jgi:hypothetical protein
VGQYKYVTALIFTGNGNVGNDYNLLSELAGGTSIPHGKMR